MICILSNEKILMLFLLTAISLAACFSSGYSIKNKFVGTALKQIYESESVLFYFIY